MAGEVGIDLTEKGESPNDDRCLKGVGSFTASVILCLTCHVCWVLRSQAQDAFDTFTSEKPACFTASGRRTLDQCTPPLGRCNEIGRNACEIFCHAGPGGSGILASVATHGCPCDPFKYDVQVFRVLEAAQLSDMLDGQVGGA